MDDFLFVHVSNAPAIFTWLRQRGIQYMPRVAPLFTTPDYPVCTTGILQRTWLDTEIICFMADSQLLSEIALTVEGILPSDFSQAEYRDIFKSFITT